MEPDRQVEIQLGHMCNNRCVFCVSGQRTAMGMARPLAVQPILDRIEEAHREGYRKITLLGGEPTIQPGFKEVLQRCHALGFEEIVIFTNGVKTARESFVDELIDTGAPINWRLSFQGATKRSHERTTGKVGSFGRLVKTLQHLHARGQRISVNMCVVQSNFEDVDAFPELLVPYGVVQLHLDMMRPLDAGERSDEELAETMPHYSEMVPALTRMIQGFPPGFDVNIGNLPFCIAPHLAPWIHHDGQTTFTVAIEGDDRLSDPWDKYDTKRRDKFQLDTCKGCLFGDRCSGVFETYDELYGRGELRPITPEAFAEAEPERRLLAVHLKPVVAGLRGLKIPAPYTRAEISETGENEVTVTLEGPEHLQIALRPTQEGGAAGTQLFSFQLRRVPEDPAVAMAGLRALYDRLTQGQALTHPLGDDALAPQRPTIAARLQRLRRAAPFPPLRWAGTELSEGGARAELRFEDEAGGSVTFWLGEQAGKATGGYSLPEGSTPSEALVRGVRAIMEALRRRPEPSEATSEQAA